MIKGGRILFGRVKLSRYDDVYSVVIKGTRDQMICLFPYHINILESFDAFREIVVLEMIMQAGRMNEANQWMNYGRLILKRVNPSAVVQRRLSRTAECYPVSL